MRQKVKQRRQLPIFFITNLADEIFFDLPMPLALFQRHGIRPAEHQRQDCG